jgi:hypothetical protein
MIAFDNSATGGEEEPLIFELLNVAAENSNEGFFYNRDAWSQAAKIRLECGALYIALSYCEAFVGDPKDRPWFKASFKEIGEACGMSARLVKRHLPALVDAGLVEVKSGRDGGKLSQRNSYKLTFSGEAWRQSGSTDNSPV